MKDIDEKILKALQHEDQSAIDALEEDLGLKDMVAMSFKGKQAWMSILIWFYTFVGALLAFYCLYRFFATTDLKASLGWSIGFLSLFFAVGMTKLFIWMQMHKLELKREIKRLELRIISASQHEEKVG